MEEVIPELQCSRVSSPASSVPGSPKAFPSPYNWGNRLQPSPVPSSVSPSPTTSERPILLQKIRIFTFRFLSIDLSIRISLPLTRIHTHTHTHTYSLSLSLSLSLSGGSFPPCPDYISSPSKFLFFFNIIFTLHSGESFAKYTDPISSEAKQWPSPPSFLPKITQTAVPSPSAATETRPHRRKPMGMTMSQQISRESSRTHYYFGINMLSACRACTHCDSLLYYLLFFLYKPSSLFSWTLSLFIHLF